MDRPRDYWSEIKDRIQYIVFIVEIRGFSYAQAMPHGADESAEAEVCPFPNASVSPP